MAKIEEYLKMDFGQLEEAVMKERDKIKKAKTEIALLEKLKIASRAAVAREDQHRNGNNNNPNDGSFHHQ